MLGLTAVVGPLSPVSSARPLPRALVLVDHTGQTPQGRYVQFSVISGNAERFLASDRDVPGGASTTATDGFARRTRIDRHGRFIHDSPGIRITGHISGKHASGTIVLSATPQTPNSCVATVRWTATLKKPTKV